VFSVKQNKTIIHIIISINILIEFYIVNKITFCTFKSETAL